MDDVGAWVTTAGGWLTVLYILLVVLVPVSCYAAQKWAYKCFRELQKIRRAMEK